MGAGSTPPTGVRGGRGGTDGAADRPGAGGAGEGGVTARPGAGGTDGGGPLLAVAGLTLVEGEGAPAREAGVEGWAALLVVTTAFAGAGLGAAVF